MDELDAALTEAGNDKDLRVLILTGAGDKAFIAGADINELARMTPMTGPETSLHGQAVLHKLETLGKPSIAAINGFALGGGCELALACSIRVASRTAKFGEPAVKWGIIPGYGGSQRLARLCGKGVAQELCLSGEMISAEEAQRIGLVNHVYEPAELLRAARAMAKKIAANGRFAVGLAMEAIARGADMPQEEGMAFEAALFGTCCETAEMREPTRTFLEKRAARFDDEDVSAASGAGNTDRQR